MVNPALQDMMAGMMGALLLGGILGGASLAMTDATGLSSTSLAIGGGVLHGPGAADHVETTGRNTYAVSWQTATGSAVVAKGQVASGSSARATAELHGANLTSARLVFTVAGQLPAVGDTPLTFTVTPAGGFEGATTTVTVPAGGTAGKGATAIALNAVPAVGQVRGSNSADAAEQLASQATTDRGSGSWSIEVRAGGPLPLGGFQWSAELQPTSYYAILQ